MDPVVGVQVFGKVVTAGLQSVAERTRVDIFVRRGTVQVPSELYRDGSVGVFVLADHEVGLALVIPKLLVVLAPEGVAPDAFERLERPVGLAQVVVELFQAQTLKGGRCRN